MKKEQNEWQTKHTERAKKLEVELQSKIDFYLNKDKEY